MTEFSSIKECLENHKGNFIGTVIHKGDLKSGTGKDGKDWQRRDYILEDTTGQVNLTAWEDNINIVEYGKTYEIEFPWWKQYKEDWYIEVGNYMKAKLATIGNPNTQKTIDNITIPSLKSDMEPSVSPNDMPKLPDAGNMGWMEDLEEEVIMMLQIEQVVRRVMRKYQPTPLTLNDQKVGMITKELFRLATKVQFKKASEL